MKWGEKTFEIKHKVSANDLEMAIAGQMKGNDLVQFIKALLTFCDEDQQVEIKEWLGEN